MHTNPWRLSAVALLIFVLYGSALAQRASLTGRISDAAGAVIPGAQVTITNVNTGVAYETLSNEEGYYTLPQLQPGDYRSTIRKDGFKPLQQAGINLQVAQVLRLDYTLEAGSLTETVNVAAVLAATVDSETSSLGMSSTSSGFRICHSWAGTPTRWSPWFLARAPRRG